MGANQFLVVGLGNPGRRYKNTRHNIGFMVVDKLAGQLGVELKKHPTSAKVGKTKSNNHDLILAKPQTFMNLSGLGVSQLIRFYKLTVEQIVVVSDDFNLPLGKLRVRAKGSAGGHNGLTSIIDHLKSQDFARIRIGIGSSFAEASHFVLSTFSQEEQEAVTSVIEQASESILFLIENGVEAAMNKYNG